MANGGWFYYLCASRPAIRALSHFFTRPCLVLGAFTSRLIAHIIDLGRVEMGWVEPVPSSSSLSVRASRRRPLSVCSYAWMHRLANVVGDTIWMCVALWRRWNPPALFILTIPLVGLTRFDLQHFSGDSDERKKHGFQPEIKTKREKTIRFKSSLNGLYIFK